MDVNQPTALLAGLSPAQFMRRHWQKKPLLVRQAIPGFTPLMSRAELFKLAAQDEVESRLIVQQGTSWTMKSGSSKAGRLPPLDRPGWTLLVQGVDLHHAGAHDLLQQFRFVPDARLDDLMISFATSGGGVGPHFDSYDVFLFQASGSRRWKISRQKDLSLQPGVPLKILQNFEAEEEFLLEAGDMLYLPPRYAHDGVAEAATGSNGKPADCMTYSIGFRAPAQGEVAAALLHQLAEFIEDEAQLDEPGADVPAPTPKLYKDPDQPATASPAAIPEAMLAFAQQAVLQALKDPLALPCALGEQLTEPKPSVFFDEPDEGWDETAVHEGACMLSLDRRTRMMYDPHHVFINGESYRAKGADARLMRQLADERALSGAALRKAGEDAIALLGDWHAAGWLHLERDPARV